MTRRIGFALSLAILPGGFVVLFLIAVCYALSKTPRGQRWLVHVAPRLPRKLVERVRSFTPLAFPAVTAEPLAH